MTPIDWIIPALYITGLITMSYRLSKGQHDQKDYFLSGRNMGWGSVGLSTMATQLGAISFISAPAFVGIREGGGMIWLSYEFGVPIAMILLIVLVVPPLFKAGVVSIYEYLERRFAASTRTLVSIVFQISRSMATGVGVYALALVLSTVLGTPIWFTILVTGGVTIIYDMLGGMKAVIYSDVMQMSIILGGILIASGFALYLIGGWETFVANLDPSRLDAIDFKGIGIGDGSEFGFLSMVIGGFFLYASFYGCNQLQAQRWLSCKDLKTGYSFSYIFKQHFTQLLLEFSHPDTDPFGYLHVRTRVFFKCFFNMLSRYRTYDHLSHRLSHFIPRSAVLQKRQLTEYFTGTEYVKDYLPAVFSQF